MKFNVGDFVRIGGRGGAVLGALAAGHRYDFADTTQMLKGVGYIVGGLIIAAFIAYLIGKLLKG